MLKARFEVDGQIHEGKVEGETITSDGNEYSKAEVDLLPPCEPSKIVGLGANYPRGGENSPEDSFLFFKPSSSVIGPSDEIIAPSIAKEPIFEGELAAVIGQDCRSVSEENASEYIDGYTCVNDVTAIDWVEDVVRLKGMDTFTPIGPYIQTSMSVPPEYPRITTSVNGEVRQDASSEKMFYSPAEIISMISECITLKEGDVVITGTPETMGSRIMEEGDTIQVTIDDVGVLENTFTTEK